ncbi:MAG: hypothetical protein GKR90_17845 [Pseudomonadales bacterium]|nr:hypothetical protein [Pseudomonadales bacterium]
MPDPFDTLTLIAEVSVAIIGFSGIVIAVGNRSRTVLTALELRRLSNLFAFSGLALTLSLVWMSIGHLPQISQEVLWSVGSLVVLVLATPWLIRDVIRVRNLSTKEREEVSNPLVATFIGIAGVLLLVQIANIAIWQSSWPFLLALVLNIVGALQQFILLIRSGIQIDSVG